MSSIEIRICALSDVNQHASWFTHVISLTDSVNDFPILKNNQAAHLKLSFGDVVPGDPTWGKAGAASQEQIEAILNFARNLPNNARVLVHCHAGVGRSPAAAMLVLMARGMLPQQAFDIIAEIRPQMWPNEWVLKLGSNALGVLGILEILESWKSKTMANKIIW